jgi:hypothetical protein
MYNHFYSDQRWQVDKLSRTISVDDFRLPNEILVERRVNEKIIMGRELP